MSASGSQPGGLLTGAVVAVPVGVAELVGVAESVAVSVAVAVSVGVAVSVAVPVFVGVGGGVTTRNESVIG